MRGADGWHPGHLEELGDDEDQLICGFGEGTTVGDGEGQCTLNLDDEGDDHTIATTIAVATDQTAQPGPREVTITADNDNGEEQGYLLNCGDDPCFVINGPWPGFDPEQGEQGGSLDVVIEASGYQDVVESGVTCDFGESITVAACETVASEDGSEDRQTITASIEIDGNADPGDVDVTVSGNPEGTCFGCFAIEEAEGQETGESADPSDPSDPAQDVDDDPAPGEEELATDEAAAPAADDGRLPFTGTNLLAPLVQVALLVLAMGLVLVALRPGRPQGP